MPNTPFGDRDAPRARFPEYAISPDESRSPTTDEGRRVPAEEKTISPWRRSIHKGEAPVTADDTEMKE